MRNIRLTVEYEGTSYGGWQVQDNSATVQGHLESGLSILLKHSVRVTGSGRTDAGVHALGQVANFLTPAKIPLRGVLCGLNALLPSDIAVKRVDEVPLDFDSRRSAKEKTYQYFLHLGPVPSAFARRTSWHVKGHLDLEAIRAGADHVVGTHDFGAFRSAGCDAPHAIRTVHDVWVEERGEFAEIGIRGTAFLRHMVRILVGTLVEVGLGKRPAEAVAELLQSGQRAHAGPTAPAHGLFLREVRYDVPVLETFP